MLKKLRNDPTVREILEHLKSQRKIPDARVYTYIILGVPGPTGKSWLCGRLRKEGFKAFEISEQVCGLIDYEGGKNKNHFIVDDIFEKVVIVLNKPL